MFFLGKNNREDEEGILTLSRAKHGHLYMEGDNRLTTTCKVVSLPEGNLRFYFLRAFCFAFATEDNLFAFLRHYSIFLLEVWVKGERCFQVTVFVFCLNTSYFRFCFFFSLKTFCLPFLLRSIFLRVVCLPPFFLMSFLVFFFFLRSSST